ncbi:hypothetical protein INR49_000255, partial [Caranx melampygus]
VHRKSVKKGFDFTLMVAGESGMGKSTLVNSLFLTDLYKDRKLLNAEERINQTVEIIKHTVDIEEKGVKLKLTIVDTPGFGDAVNNNECWKPITDYIDQQFEQYFRDESGLNRKNIQDNRVHCCLYFIPPFGHGLRPVDVEFMKALHEKVNIIPLIAKADCLTPNEIKKLKDRIRDEIDKFGIKVYQFPECDSDEDEEFKQLDKELKECTPFAVIGSNTVVEARGQRVRGRLKLAQDNRMESPIPILPLSTPDVDTEKLIKMKDEELKRMQEMLNKMQQQMHEKDQSKVFSVPHLCMCRGSQVDCSNKLLTTSDLPTSFPAGTTELHLHNNMLTSLPNGLLDDLTSLRSVSLHGNLWVCDCGVLYLRAWLLQQHPSLMSDLGVNCSSPPSLKGRLVMYLTEEEILSSCHYWYCDLALVSEVCLFVFVLVQAALLVALIVFLKRFERMTKEARRATEESFTSGEHLM